MQLRLYPKRKAPIAPSPLQQIDEEIHFSGCANSALADISVPPTLSFLEETSFKTNTRDFEEGNFNVIGRDARCAPKSKVDRTSLSAEVPVLHEKENLPEQSRSNIRETTAGTVEGCKYVAESVGLQGQQSLRIQSQKHEVSQNTGVCCTLDIAENDMPVPSLQAVEEECDCQSEPSSLSLGYGDEANRIKEAVGNVSKQLRGACSEKIGKEKDMHVKHKLSPSKKSSQKDICPAVNARNSNDDRTNILLSHASRQSKLPLLASTSRPQSRRSDPVATLTKGEAKPQVSKTDSEQSIKSRDSRSLEKRHSHTLGLWDREFSESSETNQGVEYSRASQSLTEDKETKSNGKGSISDFKNISLVNVYSEHGPPGKPCNNKEKKICQSYQRIEDRPEILDRYTSENSPKRSMGNKSGTGAADKSAAATVSVALLDDMESIPLLYDEDGLDGEDDICYRHNVSPSKECDGMVRPDLSETGQFGDLDYSKSKWNLYSEKDNRKYYQMTFMDVLSSSEDEHNQFESDVTESQSCKKARDDSGLKAKSSQKNDCPEQEQSNQVLKVTSTAHSMHGTQNQQMLSENKGEGTLQFAHNNDCSPLAERKVKDIELTRDISSCPKSDKRLKSTDFVTPKSKAKSPQGSSNLKLQPHVGKGTKREGIRFEDMPNPWIDDNMLDDYHTVTVLTEELQKSGKCSRDHDSLIHSSNYHTLSIQSPVTKSCRETEGHGNCFTAEAKTESNSEKISCSPLISVGTKMDETEKGDIATSDKITLSEVAENVDSKSKCEAGPLEAAAPMRDNENSIAEDDIAYAEVLASSEWTLRSFLRMLMPKTVQLLASHTKSYIDSCLYSDKPQERDLAEIRRICKDVLSNQSCPAHPLCNERSSSVDITLTVTPNDQEADVEPFKETGNLSHTGAKLSSPFPDSITIVPSGEPSSGENLSSLVEDSTPVDGNSKCQRVENELEGRYENLAQNVCIDAGSAAETSSKGEASLSSCHNRSVENVSRLHEGPASTLNHLPESQQCPPSPPPNSSIFSPSASSETLCLKSTYRQPSSSPPPPHISSTPVVGPLFAPQRPPPPPPLPPPLPQSFHTIEPSFLLAATTHPPLTQHPVKTSLPPAAATAASSISNKTEGSDLQTCESAVEILDKHFHSVLKEIIAKGSSNLKKSRRPSEESPQASVALSLHEAILSRLQSSVPMIDEKPLSHSNRLDSKISVVSTGDTGSWASSKESPGCLTRTSEENLDDLGEKSNEIFDVLASKKSDESVDIANSDSFSKITCFTGTENNDEQKIVKSVHERNKKGTSSPRATGYLSPVVYKNGGLRDRQSSEPKERKDEKDTKEPDSSRPTVQDVSEVSENNLMRQLERSLASRRAAFSAKGSEDNLTLTSSPEDSDHCTHASSDSLGSDWSVQERGSTFKFLNFSPDFQMNPGTHFGHVYPVSERALDWSLAQYARLDMLSQEDVSDLHHSAPVNEVRTKYATENEPLVKTLYTGTQDITSNQFTITKLPEKVYSSPVNISSEITNNLSGFRLRTMKKEYQAGGQGCLNVGENDIESGGSCNRIVTRTCVEDMINNDSQKAHLADDLAWPNKLLCQPINTSVACNKERRCVEEDEVFGWSPAAGCPSAFHSRPSSIRDIGTAEDLTNSVRKAAYDLCLSDRLTSSAWLNPYSDRASRSLHENKTSLDREGLCDSSPVLDNGASTPRRSAQHLVLSPTLTVDVRKNNGFNEKCGRLADDSPRLRLHKSSSHLISAADVTQSESCFFPSSSAINVSVFMRADNVLGKIGEESGIKSSFTSSTTYEIDRAEVRHQKGSQSVGNHGHTRKSVGDGTCFSSLKKDNNFEAADLETVSDFCCEKSVDADVLTRKETNYAGASDFKTVTNKNDIENHDHALDRYNYNEKNVVFAKPADSSNTEKSVGPFIVKNVNADTSVDSVIHARDNSTDTGVLSKAEASQENFEWSEASATKSDKRISISSAKVARDVIEEASLYSEADDIDIKRKTSPSPAADDRDASEDSCILPSIISKDIVKEKSVCSGADNNHINEGNSLCFVTYADINEGNSLCFVTDADINEGNSLCFATDADINEGNSLCFVTDADINEEASVYSEIDARNVIADTGVISVINARDMNKNDCAVNGKEKDEKTSNYSAADVQNVDEKTNKDFVAHFKEISSTAVNDVEKETMDYSTVDVDVTDEKTSEHSAVDIHVTDDKTSEHFAVDVHVTNEKTSEHSSIDVYVPDEKTSEHSAINVYVPDEKTNEHSAIDVYVPDEKTSEHSAINVYVPDEKTSEHSVINVYVPDEKTSEHSAINVYVPDEKTSEHSAIDVYVPDEKPSEHSVVDVNVLDKKANEHFVTAMTDVKKETTDYSTVDLHVTDKTSEHSAIGVHVTDEKTSEQSAIEVHVTDEKTNEHSAVDVDVTDEKTSEHSAPDVHVTDEKTSEHSAIDVDVTDEKTSEHFAVDVHVTDEKTIEHSVVDVNDTDDKIIEHSVVDVNVIDEKISEHSAVYINVTDDKTSEHSAIDVFVPDEKTSEHSAVYINVTDEKTSEHSAIDVFVPDEKTSEHSAIDVNIIDKEANEHFVTAMTDVKKETMDYSTVDLHVTDEKTSEHSAVGVHVTDEKTSEHPAIDVHVTDEKTNEHSAVDVDVTDEKTSEHSAPDVHVTDEKTSEHSAVDVHVTDDKTSEHFAVDVHVTDEKTSEHSVVDFNDTNEKTSEHSSVDVHVIDEKTSEHSVVDVNDTDEKTSEHSVADVNIIDKETNEHSVTAMTNVEKDTIDYIPT